MFRNLLTYAITLILCMIYAVLYNEYSTMIFVLVFIILPITLFLFLIPMYFFIHVQCLPCKTVINKEEEVSIPIIISNRFILPVSMMRIKVVYWNEIEKKKYHKNYFISIKAREVKRVECKLASNYCGNIIINIKSINIYDYLKLFCLYKKINNSFKLAVLPNIYEMESIIISENNIGTFESDIYSKVKKGDDPSEIFDIRQYREGDKLQRIHWKLSSKKGEIMIKEFSLPITSSVVIMVEFYYKGNKKETIKYMNGIIETTLSLSAALLQNNIVHYISFYDIEGKEYRRKRMEEEDNIYDIMEELLNLLPYEKELPVIPYQMSLYEKEEYTHMFYISTLIKAELLKELEVLYPATKIFSFSVEETGKEKVINEQIEAYKLNVNQIKESIETYFMEP